MRCEVVAIGTELLLGQIVDTNSSWIGEQLALAGIDCHLQVKVGDNPARIRAAIEAALERADAVICCGGLGPTQDDLTRDVIADVMGVELVRDDDIAARICDMFERRGRTMPENNLRQADVPLGATTMAEQPGTAPGLVCPIGAKVVYAVPGVPREMRQMVLGTVVPDLRSRSGQTAVIRSRVLRTWGESESGLAERLAHHIDELDGGHDGRTLAFLASGIEGLKVRVTAKADDDAAALAVLDDEEAALRAMLGDLVFGLDDETMEHTVLGMLGARGLTLAVAESLTGGLLGSRLTSVPGASKVFRGAVVSYASDVKHDLLGVPDGPVVSGPAAEAMADGVRGLLGADVGLATTGVAGPDNQEGQAVGTVFLGVAIGDDVFSHRVQLPGSRQQIREFSVISVLDLLRRHLAAR